MAANESHPPLAVVTGSGSGLGAAFAKQLASQGYDLVLIEANPTSGIAIQESLMQSYPTCQIINLTGDVALDSVWDELVHKVNNRSIAILINNAGILHAGEIIDSKAESLRRVVEVNLIGTVLGCQAVVPLISKEPRAAYPSGIINISSIFASISPPGFTAYNASKAGVIGLSETLRSELKPLGHNVTVVLPGVVPTELFANGSYTKESYRKQVADYLVNAELTAERVVQETLKAFSEGRLEVPIGKKATWYWRLKRWFPLRLLDKVARQSREHLK